MPSGYIFMKGIKEDAFIKFAYEQIHTGKWSMSKEDRHEWEFFLCNEMRRLDGTMVKIDSFYSKADISPIFGHTDDDLFVVKFVDYVPTEEEKERMQDKWREICQSKSLDAAVENLRKASCHVNDKVDSLRYNRFAGRVKEPRFPDTLENRNVPRYIIYPACDLVLVEHESDSTGKKYLFRAPFNSGLKIGDRVIVDTCYGRSFGFVRGICQSKHIDETGLRFLMNATGAKRM